MPNITTNPYTKNVLRINFKLGTTGSHTYDTRKKKAIKIWVTVLVFAHRT